MIKMISVKEAARQWNITERRVAELCRSGRIEGTVRQGRSWQIPADASKPADKRIRSGSYRKNQRSSCLPLPIGVSDFRLAQAEYYYVDKTMLIKDFIDERPMVTLFTRPRRFGKTLNMDMLRTFFEKTEQDTSVYFQDKKIWACGQKYRSYQGKYPVIFLTFKDVKFNTWEETFSAVRDIFAKETQRHEELRTSDRCDEYDERKYARLAEGNVTEVELSSALADLSAMLHKHHGTAPVIIIDEYDTPIQQGYMKGYYEEITLFMRNLFSGGFKDNKHLAFGFLTGILRVAKESIFSGMNNLSINSVLDHKYSAYFGFTPDEVREMAAYYGASDKYDEICEWYDGYRLIAHRQTGNECYSMYSPNSVVEAMLRHKFGTYWNQTETYEALKIYIQMDMDGLKDSVVRMLAGESVPINIGSFSNDMTTFATKDDVLTLLVHLGYLTYNSIDETVSIPNKEVSKEYVNAISTMNWHGVADLPMYA